MMGRRWPRRWVTAEDFMDTLQDDPVFLADQAARNAKREAQLAVWREAEQPVVSDLSAVGVHVDSSWDLVNTSEPYAAALPILVAHLERGGYPDRVMEGMARALAVAPAGIYWERLRNLFLKASGPDEEDGLAVALAGAAGSAHVDGLIALLQDPDHGSARLYFVRPVLRLGGTRGRDVLRSLRRDRDLHKEIRAALHRRGNVNATGSVSGAEPDNDCGPQSPKS